jgi:hypothetical protein
MHSQLFPFCLSASGVVPVSRVESFHKSLKERFGFVEFDGRRNRSAMATGLTKTAEFGPCVSGSTQFPALAAIATRKCQMKSRFRAARITKTADARSVDEAEFRPAGLDLPG